MPVLNEEYDVVVVGAGHAGCEAALASARLGLNTIIFTVSMDSVAMMSCKGNRCTWRRDGQEYRQDVYSVKDA